MSEIHGAVGSYVVNALDPDERAGFEAHLAVCPTCSREVVELGETAAELSLLASDAPPRPAFGNPSSLPSLRCRASRSAARLPAAQQPTPSTIQTVTQLPS